MNNREAQPPMNAMKRVLGSDKKTYYNIEPNANLAGAKLAGLDLTDTDLTGADLTGAKLIGAKLSNAKLNGATLKNANLSAGKNGPNTLHR